MTTYKERVGKICEGLFQPGMKITWRYEESFFLSMKTAYLTVFFYDNKATVRLSLPTAETPDELVEAHIRHHLTKAIAGFYLNSKESV